jgi:hypothetical protein
MLEALTKARVLTKARDALRSFDLGAWSTWQVVRDYDVRIIDSVGHACTVHAGSQGDAAAGTPTPRVDTHSRPQPAATGCADCVALGLVVVVTATCEVLILVAPVPLLGCAGRVGLACRAEHAVASKPCVLGTRKGGRSG